MKLLLFARRAGLLLPALLLNLLAHAQPEPIRLGQIDRQDLTNTPFVADSAAEAVVLCDYGVATVLDGAGHQVRFDRVTRLKILKKSGLHWGNGAVRLRHEQPSTTERLVNLRGTTYNLVNGEVKAEPLAETSILLDKATAHYSVQRFALPQVREGSVIEFSYTIFSDYLLNLRSWQFQTSIPVRWSEYRAVMPPAFTYKVFMQHKQPLVADEYTNKPGPLQRFRWAMRDVPALHTEPYMTTLADYVDELSFELANYNDQDITRSWTQIDQLVLDQEGVGRQLDQGIFLQNDLPRLPAASVGNALPRVAAVRALVCAAVRCSGQPALVISQPLRKTYQETHRGSVADVNFLLITALRAAGFTANPVLLSTREHGRVRAALPQLSQFNYVAASVQLPDGQQLVLDASDPLLPYDLLPERCLNQRGRLLAGPGQGRWIELMPRYRATHLQQVQLHLTAEGALRGQTHEEFSGYAGVLARTTLEQMGEKKFATLLAAQHPTMTFPTFVLARRDSVQQALALDYTFAQAAEQQTPQEQLYLSPLHEFGIVRNPFRTENRTFPVDFGYAKDEILVVTLTLPPGYTLVELPKSKALDLPGNGGRFVYSGTATGGTVQLTSRLTLRKPIYSTAEYGQLRELYRLLLEKQAEQLVIRKG